MSERDVWALTSALRTSRLLYGTQVDEEEIARFILRSDWFARHIAEAQKRGGDRRWTLMSEPTTLTAAEYEALAPWDSESYSCACPGACPVLPCHNDRDDLTATVERIVAARIALVRAAMDAARATRPSTSMTTLQTFEGCEAHGYRRGMAAALDRVGAALRVGDDA